MKKKRIVIGISGASGVPIAVACLKALQKLDGYESHLVITKGGEMTIPQETAMTVEEVKALADVCYDNKNIGASIASGTFENEGMVIVPCSMKTVSGIAHGYSDNLLLRAADVAIKEQRKLVLVARETPLSPIHLDNLSYLAKLQNVMIMPPMLTYYNNPKSMEDMERHIAGKILHQFGIELEGFKRWC